MLRLIHKNQFAEIYRIYKKWIMVIYDSKADVVDYRFYNFRQSAIRYAERNLN